MPTSPIVETRSGVVDLLQLHRLSPERYPFLLQSVVHGTVQSRYDILFAYPQQELRLDQLSKSSHFLNDLDAAWQAEAAHHDTDIELPFSGGWFVYLAYELAAEVEPGLQLSDNHSGLPVAYACRIPAAIIIDHQQQQTLLVAEAGHQDALAQLAKDLAAANTSSTLRSFAPDEVRIHEEAPAQYIAGVERIKRYIVDGDVFQANLSRGWQVELPHDVSADQLYDNLRHHNAAPFAALAQIGDAAVISSSPERLVDVHGDQVSTRPIAGTRPRGNDLKEDQAYLDTLIGHPKERAEHVMLIDLERNDLGRVCQPGSVHVDELMVLESYAHVHHIVSNVRGRLRTGVTPGQVIAAVFPGGTITGCPKVRCMEIIQELEQVARGPYTGSLGYLNHDGSMDLNILIRTMCLNGRQLSFRTGAGIVYDSIAEAEVEETRAKAKGLLRALGVAC